MDGDESRIAEKYEALRDVMDEPRRRPQSALWEPAGLSRLAESWPPLAESRLSMGDATIKEVAEFYAMVPGCHIEILTGDAGLKAYEPIKPVLVPRRRR